MPLKTAFSTRFQGSQEPMALKIKFVDFWPGFEPGHNLLLSALKTYFSDTRIVSCMPGQPYDICFCSIFGTERFMERNRIMFLGENIRPDYQQCEASLSSDLDSYCGMNHYLPLWLLEYDIFQDNPYSTFDAQAFESLTKRQDPDPDFSLRSNQICAIFNNRELARINLLGSLGTAQMIDGYGRYYGRSFAPGYASKIALLRQYKFHFCTENSYWPGYITEKIVHAKAAGCIPIYDSRNDSLGYLNTKSFIDLKNHDSSAIIGLILDLVENRAEFLDYLSEPLFCFHPFTASQIAGIVARTVCEVLARA